MRITQWVSTRSMSEKPEQLFLSLRIINTVSLSFCPTCWSYNNIVDVTVDNSYANFLFAEIIGFKCKIIMYLKHELLHVG